jgi:hypothetical protein
MCSVGGLFFSSGLAVRQAVAECRDNRRDKNMASIDPDALKEGLKIVAALAPFAIEVSKDAYHWLRERVAKKVEGDPVANKALAEFEEQPDSQANKERLAHEFVRLGIVQDEEVVQAADKVLALIDARQVMLNPIDVKFGDNAQGNVVGQEGQATNYFGVPPQPTRTTGEDTEK